MSFWGIWGGGFNKIWFTFSSHIKPVPSWEVCIIFFLKLACSTFSFKTQGKTGDFCQTCWVLQELVISKGQDSRPKHRALKSRLHMVEIYWCTPLTWKRSQKSMPMYCFHVISSASNRALESRQCPLIIVHNDSSTETDAGYLKVNIC